MNKKGYFRNRGLSLTAILTCLMLTTAIISIFCLKRYFKNSNVINYELSSFSISEEFDSKIENGVLSVYPKNQDGEVIGFCAESSKTLIPKGNYTVGITYGSDSNNKAYLQAGDSVYEEMTLPAGEQTVFCDFKLE